MIPMRVCRKAGFFLEGLENSYRTATLEKTFPRVHNTPEQIESHLRDSVGGECEAGAIQRRAPQRENVKC
jgi:hypothetical protein